MKKKLLEALKQGYKNLGLSEEAFERVATFGETFVTSDEQIETFVKAAASMLKAEQSAADKVRTELNAKIKGLEGEKAELEAKLKQEPTPKEPDPKSKESDPDPNSQIAAIIAKNHTIIRNADIIKRGYEKPIAKLKNLNIVASIN